MRWLGALIAVGCAADTEPLDRDAVDASVEDAVGFADAVGFPDAVAFDAEPPDAGLHGKAIGEACMDPSECSSADSPHAGLFPSPCITNGGNPWPGGYCTDFCMLPDDPFVLPQLVRAGCPEGAVCLPRTQGTDPMHDGIGACFAECTADDQCRTGEGYYCRKSFWRPNGPITFDNGYCAPNHCQSRGCPYSFVCGC